MRILMYLLVLTSLEIASADSRNMMAQPSNEIFAENGVGQNCTALVKECFAYGEKEFNNCLVASGRHSFCKNSELGDLILKRSKLSSSVTQSDDESQFTGPQLLDKDCIKNFDSQLSSVLSNSAKSKERIKELDIFLKSCNREAPLDLVRP